MTSRKTIALLALVLFTVLAAGTAEARRGRPAGPRWELLGERTVTDKVDHDVLTVTAARGTFRSLKLEVRGRSVQFHSVKIHFGDGETQDVELRNVIPAGGESRTIDVEGRDRVIRSIEFRYDAQSLLGKKAVVLVYGRN
ncbi:MAG: hypothetical protein ABUT39_19440 [Acidobacteriota bacterium]